MNISSTERTDTYLIVETPEGVDLRLQPAGIAIRAKAYAIDLLIRFLILFLLFSFAPLVLNVYSHGFLLISIFVLSWFYGVMFEVFRDGQTPGKRYCKLRAVQENGLPLSLKAAIARNFFREIDFLPAFYTVGIVSMLANDRFQRIGDMVARTVVVYEQKPNHQLTMPTVPAKFMNIKLDNEQQSAVINLAERHQLISQERQVEIANIIAPVIHCKDQQALNALYAYANWLVGKES